MMAANPTKFNDTFKNQMKFVKVYCINCIKILKGDTLAEDTFKNIDEITEPKQEDQKQKEDNKKETAKKEKKVEQKQTSKKQSKKSVKKNKTKEIKSKEHKSRTPDWVIIALSAILIVAVVVGAYFIFINVNPETKQDSVVAIVNGEPIYESEVSVRTNMIKSMNDPTIDRNTTLTIMIDELILYQEAQKQGYKTTLDEVDQYLETILLAASMTQKDFEGDLKTAGIKLEDLKELYIKTLTVNKMLNETIISKINITEKEINKFYEENEEDLSLPERVTVKHILLSSNSTVAAEDVESMILPDKSNFCELVETYSADFESISTCGEYTFTRLDPMVQEFLDASFNMTEGEVRTVQTVFGTHIIYKVRNIPEGTPSLNELRLEITSYLTNQLITQNYLSYLNDLRNESIIEIYNGQNNSSLNTTLSDNITKELVKPEESSQLSLASCLTEKGAKLYKVYWCPHCEEQIKDFEEYASELDVIECDPEGENPRVEECQAAGINALPTWIINGKKYEGKQSLQKLAEYSGCQY